MIATNSSSTAKEHTQQPPERVPNYAVITPAFNEERNIEATIDSMICQVVRPRIWVIVDDGSTDRTWEIARAAAKSYSWIRAHRRPKSRRQGNDGLLVASEATAFLEGLKLALKAFPNPEFIVKLDADLKFAPDYFMTLLHEYSKDPELGIAGGVIYECRGSDLVREKNGRAHVRGATKIYRHACYKDISGVRPVFGWDVIDEILARASGWHVTSFDYVPLIHLRRTASRNGRFAGWARNGYMAYYIGMSPLRILLRAFYRLIVAGDVIQSCGLAYGYFTNFMRRTQRLPDHRLRKLVRHQQWVTAQAVRHNQAHRAEHLRKLK